jgi:pimeloyl-ACP methyl ester carboxylesterase
MMRTRRSFLAAGASAMVCAVASAAGFVCPPCGCAKDGEVFANPGTCPACGMRLIPASMKRDDAGERDELEVSENRRDPGARRIRLRYLRLRSTSGNPGFPIVYLAGGPGGSGIRDALGRHRELLEALRSVGDVIALDQRGTGESNAIPVCEPEPIAGDIVLTRAGAASHAIAEFRRCREFWRSRGVAIEGYNTRESAADLEDLRRLLGAKKLNLLGASYGSHLAMAALKYHGASIGRVALGSLEGLHQTVKLPSRLDGVFEYVDRRLKVDAETRKNFPDFLGSMRRVHARLEREPARVTFKPGPTEPPVTLVLGAFIVQGIAGSMGKDPGSLAQVPALYRMLDAGDYELFAHQLHAMTRGFRQPMRGMPEAMDISSGISSRRLAQVSAEAKNSLLGDALNYPMPHAREAARDLDLGDEFRAAGRFSAPALLMAGTLDGRTPLAEQREAGAQFSDARWTTIENGGHEVLESTPALRAILARFFRGESLSDTTVRLPEPSFVPR